jgi:microsomal dipeptidase-like Zn-dependent dipeptidase
MIKKFTKFLLVLALFALVIFFFVVGKVVDRSMNKIEELENFPISNRARILHEKLLVCDLHADNLLWDRDLTSETSHGKVDIPKLLSGNYAIQVFDAVIKTPKGINYEANTAETDDITLLAAANRWPIKAWGSLLERAIHQSNVLKDAANSSAALEMIYNKSDLSYFMSLRKNNSYKVAGVLSIEGLHALEGDFNNLEVLYESGYRIMGLVHFFDNEVGGSSAGVAQGGLTDFGRRILRKMEKKQIIIDLAHSSPPLFQEVMSIATRPVMVSHTGVKGVYNSPRNLSDEQLKQIADNDGLVGIGFWAEAAGSTHPSSIAQSIRYAVDLIGIKHVALGSDFDGAVTTSFSSANIIFLTEALIQEGFSDEEITMIMGGNQIQFLKNNLPG